MGSERAIWTNNRGFRTNTYQPFPFLIMIQLSTQLSLFHFVASYWFWHILYFPISGKYIALIDWPCRENSRACRQSWWGNTDKCCIPQFNSRKSRLCASHLIERNLLADVDFAYLYFIQSSVNIETCHLPFQTEVKQVKEKNFGTQRNFVNLDLQVFCDLTHKAVY